jgi:hypothetical protein
MKITKRPIRTTVIFGLICGLSFMPLTLGLCTFFPWPIAFSIILWSYIAMYGFLLTRWSGKSPLSIIFPLLLLLIFVFVTSSNSAFVLVLLVIFSWIRSGICFKKRLSRVFGAEFLLTLGGAALIAWFTPHSTLTWALGIWMFSLVQSLYFVNFEDKSIEDKVTMDPFEEAMLRAEKIIVAQLYS